MIRGIEAHLRGREGELGLLELQVVVQRAVVGASRATEDDVRLVSADVVRESEAWLEGIITRFAVVARADVVVDVYGHIRVGGQAERLAVRDSWRHFRIERIQQELRCLKVEV